MSRIDNIEQLKFAREIGATHIDTRQLVGELYRKDRHAYLDGQWEFGWAGVSILNSHYCFTKIDFTPLDDYYADKAVDIATTGGEVMTDAANEPDFNGVPDGYYHDDEEDKLKPLKPAAESAHDRLTAAVKAYRNELGLDGAYDQVLVEAENLLKSAVPSTGYDQGDVAFKRPENERVAGLKYDSGKPRISLVPPHALTEMAKVMTFGASKYKAHSWKQVENAQERYLDALLRHAIAYVAGERIDPESGLPTMAHLMCDAAFLIELDMLNDNGRTAGE